MPSWGERAWTSSEVRRAAPLAEEDAELAAGESEDGQVDRDRTGSIFQGREPSGCAMPRHSLHHPVPYLISNRSGNGDGAGLEPGAPRQGHRQAHPRGCVSPQVARPEARRGGDERELAVGPTALPTDEAQEVARLAQVRGERRGSSPD